MPICPNCGSYVSEGSHTCSCGTSFSYNSSYEKEEYEDPEESKRKKMAADCYMEASSLEKQGRYFEALQMYEESKRLGSSLFTLWVRARLYNKMGEHQKALECYQKFMGNGKDDITLRLIADTLIQLERYDEALDMLFEALGIINNDPKYVPDYTNPSCGRYYTREELDERAQETIKSKKKALAEVYREIAWAYRFQERYNVAVKYIDEAIDFDGKNANYWNVKAIILEDMGKYGKSLKCYDKAIEMEWETVFIENRARMIKRCCLSLYEKGKGLKKAERFIDEAIEQLSSIQTEEDISEYMQLRDDIKSEREYSRQLDRLKEIGSENLITITGTSYCGYPNFNEGMILKLVKEPENEFDGDAIAIYSGEDKVGYVANSPNTVCTMTTSASDLDIHDVAHAEYLMNYRFEFRIALLRRDLDRK